MKENVQLSRVKDYLWVIIFGLKYYVKCIVEKYFLYMKWVVYNFISQLRDIYFALLRNSLTRM